MSKVKIASTVSNEAYFMPQWIHHHQYFGFEYFDLYVNRVTDNTYDVLRKLQNYYGNISIHNWDWVDKEFNYVPPNGFLQNSAYMFDYMNHSQGYDYTLYIDADEFWMPANSLDSISQCILSFDNPDAIVFEWFLIGGSSSYIMPLFSNRYLYGSIWHYTKSLIRNGLHVAKFNAHCPIFNDIDHVIVGDGSEHKFNRRDFMTISPSQRTQVLKDYFILHDAVRSPIFNFAKYVSPRPHISTTFTASGKPNRQFYFQMMSGNNSITFHNNVNNDYYAQFYKMMESTDMWAELRKAKIHQLLYTLALLRKLYEAPASEFTLFFVERMGEVEEYNKTVLQELISLDHAYDQLTQYALTSPAKLIVSDKDRTINNLIAASRLYPYETDEKRQPIFIKTLLLYLIDKGDFANCLKILSDIELPSVRTYGPTWALPILADGYKNKGYYQEAENLYKRMEYSNNKDFYRSLDEVAKKVS